MISDAQTVDVPVEGREGDITVENLLNNPLFLEKVITEALSTNFSRRPRRIISYIRDVKGIYVYDQEHKLTMTIMRKLQVMAANGKVKRDDFGYRLVSRIEK